MTTVWMRSAIIRSDCRISTRPVDEQAVDDLLDMFMAAYSTTR